MRRVTTLLFTFALALTSMHVAAAQLPADEQRALRERIESRYEVVMLTDDIALKPKTRMSDVRLIEISDAGVVINGVPVTGREVRERLGDDAQAILRLTYVSPEDRRAMFAPRERDRAPGTEVEAQTPVEASPSAGPRRTRERRSGGDRVRIFGNVRVDEDEEIGGQAVAVLGSARVDGEVRQQVVAVLGSVTLGPKAIVHGDVVSVGGNVHRAPGAVIRGGVTEIALSHLDDLNLGPLSVNLAPFYFFDGFGAVPRLIGSSFRLMLLVLLALIAMVVARPTVERAAERVSDNPVKTALVGLVSVVLIPPVFILTTIVLAITIIGIPVLVVLSPFALLVLIAMAVAGFAGSAFAVGQWTRRRFAISGGSALSDVAIGVFMILLPLLFGRVLAIAGWPLTPVAIMFIAGSFAFELLVWAAGFGAVLTNGISSWQAHRATRRAVVAPPPSGP